MSLIKLSPYRKDTALRTKMEFERLAKIAGVHPNDIRYAFNPNGWFLAEIPLGANPKTLPAISKAFAKRSGHLFASTTREDPIILTALDDMNEKGFRSVPAAFDVDTTQKCWVVGAVNSSTLSRLERVSYDVVIDLCGRYRKRDLTCAFKQGRHEENDEIGRLLSLLDRNKAGERAYQTCRTKPMRKDADRISGYVATIHEYNLLKRNSGKQAQTPSV